jgi:hypothetical protein
MKGRLTVATPMYHDPRAQPLVLAGVAALDRLGCRAGLPSVVLWMQCGDILHGIPAPNCCWYFRSVGRGVLALGCHSRTASIRAGPHTR